MAREILGLIAEPSKTAGRIQIEGTRAAGVGVIF
jgi:hypothetical protein